MQANSGQPVKRHSIDQKTKAQENTNAKHRTCTVAWERASFPPASTAGKKKNRLLDRIYTEDAKTLIKLAHADSSMRTGRSTSLPGKSQKTFSEKEKKLETPNIHHSLRYSRASIVVTAAKPVYSTFQVSSSSCVYEADSPSATKYPSEETKYSTQAHNETPHSDGLRLLRNSSISRRVPLLILLRRR